MFKLNEMTALEYLTELPRGWLPQSREGSKRGFASKGEIRRWLRSSSVIINGMKPQPHDVINLPICQLIFFPKGRTVTIIDIRRGQNG